MKLINSLIGVIKSFWKKLENMDKTPLSYKYNAYNPNKKGLINKLQLIIFRYTHRILYPILFMCAILMGVLVWLFIGDTCIFPLYLMSLPIQILYCFICISVFIFMFLCVVAECTGYTEEYWLEFLNTYGYLPEGGSKELPDGAICWGLRECEVSKRYNLEEKFYEYYPIYPQKN